MGAPRFVLDRFWPSNLFLGGIPGAWYDPTDLSTMFQDSTGTTPVTAVEQPVGRILDKSGNGNHASQSTAASRPTYRARYNLLTYSEQFDNAAWFNGSAPATSVTPNVAVAPDGTTTADKVSAAVAINWYQPVTTVNLATHTFSCYLKQSGGATTCELYIFNLGSVVFVARASFNFSTGVATNITGTGATMTAVGNGWFRCTVTGAGGTNTSIGLYNTTEVLAWGAQLLTAADVTATGNAYQRIAAATVYDTAPIFRPYLAFDGMDDSLSTAAINFTSTDKMTVFSGVTKSSDAATGALAEISADAGTNNGAWLLAMPTGAAALAFNWAVRGTASVANAVANSLIAPATAVLACTADITAPSSVTRKNAAIVQALVTSLGTGSFGNYQLFVGRRNNSLIPFNGRLYSLIVRGAASSVTEIADTELWVNARTGAY